MPVDRYRRGRRYGNGGHKAGRSRLEKLEEMQWSIVRQKDASETEGEGLQNSDQASDVTRSRNVGYNEETRKTDRGERDEDAIRWMCGVTCGDKIRNEHIRGTTRVAQSSKKITERRTGVGV